jgi:hypothetical protein
LIFVLYSKHWHWLRCDGGMMTIFINMLRSRLL